MTTGRVFGGVVLVVFVVGLATAAYRRGGFLDLPRVPRGLGPERIGLADLPGLAARERALGSGAASGVLEQAARGLVEIENGRTRAGLDLMQQALREEPDDLVLGNAYRIAVFKLRRGVLADGGHGTNLSPRMPRELQGEPLVFLETLAKEHGGPGSALQLALAWVDEMLLFPALEIKAPASVQSVGILSRILDEDPYYVPALYARGLNYLHRPARLVWPESKKAPPDAASRDLALCMALGRQTGIGSPDLVGMLALTLGDAYAKEGRAGKARSWWQIAENTSRRPELRAAVTRRWGFEDEELVEEIEAELERSMQDIQKPMTDLAFLWR